jgi:Tol biopolymer transport system component
MRPFDVQRKAAIVAVAATLALVTAALNDSAARATVPGPNGLVIYQATVGKHIQLFTVRPDGSGMRRLTRFADSDSVHASWSPDGARVAFERDFPKHAGIYTMSLDGGDLVSLTPHGLQGMPAYSPDGMTIAFDRTLPKEDALWIMNADGSELRQLTHNKPAGKNECRCDESPIFSPNGKRIAFVRTISDLQTAAFVVNVDGTGLEQLTPWRFGVSAKLDWSPDGSRIVISSPQAEQPNVASNVFTIRPDGTGLKQVTHETKRGVHDLADGFSPDGTKIIFAKTVDGGPFQVYVINADGTGVRRLTHGVDAHWASWGRRP